ncbi:hypothetical protein [Pantoea ananatis]|uniref:hypothetical protein n=1 Tax=Pantoea ananas TaxID=553 RepID=UPI001B304DCD|nr:hypothetical protein [Pantoea ananatis]
MEARLEHYRFAVIRLGRYGYSEDSVRRLSAVALEGVLAAVTRFENPKGKNEKTFVSLRRRRPKKRDRRKSSPPRT